ncbi:hypothetical protein [Pantoea trifolii]|uniref:Oligosaccharide repeat unit polymerase n=1 Tax=Pantoea trifolii TaxID=2968030 RepID=A0ABT1VL89_9GAMM|nr:MULTISPECIES: hypothetical protein [unclassified Pantoea]MCQ8228297.1 hypothetical protein [Pantoea sp. MMK2]MCQ8236470.1 hypothetical protein [Pantoea sp. MMK3]
MVINKSDLFLVFCAPVAFFIIGYAEYLGYISNAVYLEFIVIPVSVISLVIYCYRNSPAFLYTSGMTFYYYIGMLVSLVIASTGMLMIEINETGTPNGAAFMMLSFFIYSVGISKVSFEWTLKKPNKIKIARLPANIISKFLLSTMSVVFILGLAILIFYSGPVLKGVNRVAFWDSMGNTGFSFYPTLVIQTFYFSAYYFLLKRFDRQNSKLSLLLLIFYIFITFMVLGQKFSAFIVYITIFFALYPSFNDYLKFKKKSLFFIFAIFALLVLMLALSYSLQGYDVTFILTRVVLQGQVMWSVINHSFPDIVSNERYCLTGCDNFTNVYDYISYDLLPIQTYLHYNATGTNLSGFSPAVQIHFMGLLPTLILQTIIFVLLGFLQAKMVLFNKDRNFIMGFLIFKLSFSIFLIWHAVMFSAWKGTVLTVIAILIYLLATKSISKIKGKNCDGRSSLT